MTVLYITLCIGVYRTLPFDELLTRASRSENLDNHFICPVSIRF